MKLKTINEFKSNSVLKEDEQDNSINYQEFDKAT